MVARVLVVARPPQTQPPQKTGTGTQALETQPLLVVVELAAVVAELVVAELAAAVAELAVVAELVVVTIHQ